MRLRLFAGLNRDARLIIIMMGLISLGYFGVMILLRSLYLLRLGQGPEYLGIFGTASAFSFMAMCLPGGAIGQRLGMQRAMRISGVVMVLGLALFPLAEFVPSGLAYLWPMLAQAIAMFGWAVLSVNSGPALMGVTLPEQRGHAFALNSAMRGAGIFVGTLLGGLLPGWFAPLLGRTLATPDPYRWALWTSVAMVALGMLPLWFLGPISAASSHKEEVADDSKPFPLWPVALILLHAYLTHMAWSVTQSFCSPYMDTDLGLSTSAIGALTAVGQLAGAVLPLIGPRLAAQRGQNWVLTASALGIGLSMLPLALIPNWAGAGLGRLGVLAGAAIWLPAVQVFQMEMVSPRWRSMVFAASSMVSSLSFGSASLVGGMIIVATGYRQLFLITAALPLAGGALTWLLRRMPGWQPRPRGVGAE